MPPNTQPLPPQPQPMPPSPQSLPPVRAKNTNYAAAVFFTLLIVGFTFDLASLVKIPLVIFCISAGILFFRDLVSLDKQKKAASGGQPQPVNIWWRIIKIALLIIVLLPVLWIGFIFIALIIFTAGGGHI